MFTSHGILQRRYVLDIIFILSALLWGECFCKTKGPVMQSINRFFGNSLDTVSKK